MVTPSANAGRYTNGDAPLERPVPYDLQAEEAVIGSLLLDRDAIAHLTSLKGAHFYREINGWIFDTIRELFLSRPPVPPDLVTLSSALDRKGILDQIGGLAYLAGLMHRVPTAVHVEYYAQIVEDAAVLRRLISAGGKIAGLGYEEGLPLEEVLAKAHALLDQVTQARERAGALVPIGETLYAHGDLILGEAQPDDKIVTGLPSFAPTFDENLSHGFQRGAIGMIVAQTGVGKTNALLDIALCAAQAGYHIGYYSLEMPVLELEASLIAKLSGVPRERVRYRKLRRPDDLDRIMTAYSELCALPIYLDDAARQSVQTALIRARQAHAKYHLDGVLVDYVQLMTDEEAERNRARYEELGKVSRGLLALAGDLDVAVIEAAQMTATDEGTGYVGFPSLKVVRESKDLTNDSTLTTFLIRDPRDRKREGKAVWWVAKNRYGPLGWVALDVDVTTMTFREAAVQELPDWWQR